MAKRIFISFNFKELEFKNNLVGLFQGWGGVIQASPAFVENDVSNEGAEAIKREIRLRMQGCRGLICVVGRDAHNSPWISHELGLANQLQIPKVAVRHPQVYGGLPNPHLGMQVVEWSGWELANVVGGW